MAQRRFHSKSRHGCQQCKKNRSKCDENRPKCGRCDRIGLDCSLSDDTDIIFVPAKENQKDQINTNLLDSKPALSSAPNNLGIDSPDYFQSLTISNPSSASPLLESHFSETEIDRLRLMSYYTLHTSKSITEVTIPKHQDQTIWSHWVTELALNSDFLLHGLLSLSALHLVLQDTSRQKYTVLAIQHHVIGISLFRPLLSNITAETYDTIFAFSCTVVLYSFGIQRLIEPEVDIITKIRHILILLRQSAVVTKSNHELVMQSRWSMLIIDYPFKVPQKFSNEIENMLSLLLDRASTTAPASNRETLTAAVQALKDNLWAAVTYKRTSASMTWFPIMSPADFWVMIGLGERLALAILANYAVVLHWLEPSIWIDGWGGDIVHAIHETLPAEWHECVAWAIQETRVS